jgi:hypothetical protein
MKSKSLQKEEYAKWMVCCLERKSSTKLQNGWRGGDTSKA